MQMRKTDYIGQSATGISLKIVCKKMQEGIYRTMNGIFYRHLFNFTVYPKIKRRPLVCNY